MTTYNALRQTLGLSFFFVYAILRFLILKLVDFFYLAFHILRFNCDQWFLSESDTIRLDTTIEPSFIFFLTNIENKIKLASISFIFILL